MGQVHDVETGNDVKMSFVQLLNCHRSCGTPGQQRHVEKLHCSMITKCQDVVKTISHSFHTSTTSPMLPTYFKSILSPCTTLYLMLLNICV